jgi:hypothetical protein
VDVVRHTVEQNVFVCESYVKCSARKCRRKFPVTTVPNATRSHELIKEVMSLPDKKRAGKWPCAYRSDIKGNMG